jgi:uncharacterized protein YggE
MNQMSKPHLQFWPAGLLALGLAASCGSSVAADVLPRSVSVTGSGEVRAQPDMAYVTLGVEARKPTLAEARNLVAATVERVLGLARELKIDPRYVDSTALQVQPEYRWNDKDAQRVLLGYVVSRQVEIELRNLEQLGALLERSVTAGVNQVGSPRLDSTRRKELERDALARGVADARLNAEALARAAGATLGPVRTLSASAEAPVVPMYRERVMMAQAVAADAEQTYESREMKFSATVNAQYDLIPAP